MAYNIAKTVNKQRVELEQDKALKQILHHNMVEQIEHDCMTPEWLRRNMEGWDGPLKEFLFKDGQISH